MKYAAVETAGGITRVKLFATASDAIAYQAMVKRETGIDVVIAVVD